MCHYQGISKIILHAGDLTPLDIKEQNKKCFYLKFRKWPFLTRKSKIANTV